MPETTAEEAWMTSEERMKELIANAWDTVKRLTLQVTFVFLCLELYQLKRILSVPVVVRLVLQDLLTLIVFRRKGFDLWF